MEIKIERSDDEKAGSESKPLKIDSDAYLKLRRFLWREHLALGEVDGNVSLGMTATDDAHAVKSPRWATVMREKRTRGSTSTHRQKCTSTPFSTKNATISLSGGTPENAYQVLVSLAADKTRERDAERSTPRRTSRTAHRSRSCSPASWAQQANLLQKETHVGRTLKRVSIPCVRGGVAAAANLRGLLPTSQRRVRPPRHPLR